MRRAHGVRGSLAFAIGLALAACGGEPSGHRGSSGAAGDPEPVATYVDRVAALNTQCTFVAGLMTVVVDAGETAVITKRASDSAILANGEVCNDGSAGGRGVAPNVTVSNSALKKIVINEASPGQQTVVLDFGNGLFAMSNGTASTGIVVDLGTETTDHLSIFGTASGDTVSIGAVGVSINDASHVFLTFAQPVANLSFALGAGDDRFTAGGDTLAGGLSNGPYVPVGPLTIDGGPGNDTFRQGKVPTWAEIIVGGAGTDTVDYSQRTAGVRVSLGSVTTGDDGDVAYLGGIGEQDDIAGDVEIVLGGLGNDTLSSGLSTCTITGGCVTLNGGPGDDVFDQGTAASKGEILIGGAGIDTVDYGGRTGALNVTMDGAKNDDGDRAAAENDNVGADCERLYAGDGNDTLSGNALANTISGGLGNDTIHGLDGDDVFVMVARDYANGGFSGGGDGDDVIFGDNGADRADYALRAGPVTATLHDGTAGDAFVGDSGAGGEKDDLRVENLQGSLGDVNVLNGNSAANELVGGPFDDVLHGGGGDDVLDGAGGAAADTFQCGAGFDVTMNAGSGGSTWTSDCEI